MKTYKFLAWVHPAAGGDDFPVEGKTPAPSLRIAKKQIALRLKSLGSAILDDFTVKEAKDD